MAENPNPQPSGNNDDPPEIDMKDSRVQAAIQQAVDNATEGLKGNRDQVLNEKRQEAEARQKAEQQVKTINERLEAIGGIERIEKLTSEQQDSDLLKALGESPEALRDVAGKQIREVWERKEAKWNEEREALTTKANEADQRYRNREIDLAVRNQVADKVIPESASDVSNLIRSSLELNDEGNVVERETGRTLSEVLDEFLENRPYYRPKSQGGGAGGSGTTTAGAKNRSQMTVKEKTQFISQHGQAAYFELPK